MKTIVTVGVALFIGWAIRSFVCGHQLSALRGSCDDKLMTEMGKHKADLETCVDSIQKGNDALRRR